MRNIPIEALRRVSCRSPHQSLATTLRARKLGRWCKILLHKTFESIPGFDQAVGERELKCAARHRRPGRGPERSGRDVRRQAFEYSVGGVERGMIRKPYRRELSRQRKCSAASLPELSRRDTSRNLLLLNNLRSIVRRVARNRDVPQATAVENPAPFFVPPPLANPSLPCYAPRKSHPRQVQST